MSAPTPPGGAPAAWWARAYRLALRAFPPEFRARWGDDMRRTYADRVDAARAARGATPWRLVARELVAATVVGLAERARGRALRHAGHAAARPLTSTTLAMRHLQDLRYALRLLARAPGFALLTVLVLAGGLGVSTFTLSFLHTAMVRPLPLDEGARIVRLSAVADGRHVPIDHADVPELRSSLRAVRQLGGWTRREVIAGRTGEGRVLVATVGDPTLFAVARTPALLGRTLVPADAAPGAEPVMVLAHRTWTAAYGGDPAIVGRHVPVNGTSTRIVGVMPPAFGFPIAQDAWLPLPDAAATRPAPGEETVALFARLAPGATPEQASAEATALLRRLLAARDTVGAERRDAIARPTVVAESFPAAQIGDERPWLFAGLNATAALILLLAVVNVATLLGARATERAREAAVRMALGASPARLAVQGMWESAVLCVAGGVLGTLGAAWALETVTRWTREHLPGNMVFWWVWAPDRVTVLAAAAFVTVAVTALGIAAAVRATRTNVAAVLQDGTARAGGRRAGRVTRVLVATQVGVVTVLMFVGVLAGVLAHRVVTLDPGYDPAGLLQAALVPPVRDAADASARQVVFRRVHDALATHAAVDRVLLRAPLAARGDAAGRFARRGTATAALPTAHVHATLGTLATLGVPVLEGRALQATDDAAQAPVALVSRALAARHWPGRSPVGEQVRLAGLGDSLRWRTIVGVVGDVPYGNLLATDRSAEAIYVPLAQTAARGAEVIVHQRAGEVAGRQALHEAFAAVDPLLVPRDVYRTSEVLEKSGLIAVGVVRLFGGCFAFALLLAVAGTYGLMARAVAQRTREVGVRRALGASGGAVARLLLGQGARQLGVGTLAAAPALVAIGIAATRALPLDPRVAAVAGLGVSASVVAIVVLATWVPTRRVVRLAPRDALWRE